MKTDNSDWIIHTDGGARGNPGPAAIGVVIEKGGDVVSELHKKIGVATNNVAEYQAVVEALDALLQCLETDKKGERVVFYLDSLLVVQQLMGVYKIKNANLGLLYAKVKFLEHNVGLPVTYMYIPREKNRHADSLVNRALDAAF